MRFISYNTSLFIYQPKTIDKAIALPGDVLLLNSVAISVDPPPTLILMDEYAVKIPTVLIPVADELH